MKRDCSDPDDAFGMPEVTAGSEELRDRLKRSAYLRHLLVTYSSSEDDKPHDAPIWEGWLARSGELPPDFDALPTNAFLPDVLTSNDGGEVRTPEEWNHRRGEIAEMLEYYQLGSSPPPPPALAVEDLGSFADEELGGMVRSVRLVFGPSEKAVAAAMLQAPRDASMYETAPLRVDVFIPSGTGPFPAVVEVGKRQDGRLVGYLSPAAAKREYVVCTFDRVDAFAAKDVYTDCDCNQLVWWAYATSRCIDYLYRIPEVDHSKIAVIGHSRGGKMSLIAAALDERIAATIASHTGSAAGTVPPWRYMGEKYGAETLEASTRLFAYWNHPRMRFFTGRENKLPFDSHYLMALVAPRSLLVTEGDADDVGEPWGAQQAYLATKKVYELLGCPERCNIAYSSGAHRLAQEVMEEYADWLDMQFGRRPLEFSDELMYTYTFSEWQEVTSTKVDILSFPQRGLDDLLIGRDGAAIETRDAWEVKRDTIRERILWGLGALPPTFDIREVRLEQIGRTATGLARAVLPIDGKLVAHLTYPEGACAKLPVVIYLHGYLDAMGHDWSSEYGWTPSVGERLAQKGFLAVEYDQFGYGTRNHDSGIEFFAEHPDQSAMGVMVQDVRSVVNALACLDMVDPDRVMVAGFSLGGAVGLLAGALDERIKAVASTCGFASMRLDAHGNETEGLMRYSHLRPTMPRLGFFVGHEKRVPFDFHEILSLIAPRPVLVVAPMLDQDWFHADVEACCDAVVAVYRLLGAEHSIELHAPLDFNRYPPKYQNVVNEWLSTVAECLS